MTQHNILTSWSLWQATWNLERFIVRIQLIRSTWRKVNCCESVIPSVRFWQGLVVVLKTMNGRYFSIKLYVDWEDHWMIIWLNCRLVVSLSSILRSWLSFYSHLNNQHTTSSVSYWTSHIPLIYSIGIKTQVSTGTPYPTASYVSELFQVEWNTKQDRNRNNPTKTSQTWVICPNKNDCTRFPHLSFGYVLKLTLFRAHSTRYIKRSCWSVRSVNQPDDLVPNVSGICLRCNTHDT